MLGRTVGNTKGDEKAWRKEANGKENERKWQLQWFVAKTYFIKISKRIRNESKQHKYKYYILRNRSCEI